MDKLTMSVPKVKQIELLPPETPLIPPITELIPPIIQFSQCKKQRRQIMAKENRPACKTFRNQDERMWD